MITPYILDFYCSSKKLAIEIDGGMHNDREKYDQAREDFLKEKGIKVIRFTHTEVRQNLAEVLERTKESLNNL